MCTNDKIANLLLSAAKTLYEGDSPARKEQHPTLRRFGRAGQN